MLHFLAAGSIRNRFNMWSLESGENVHFGVVSRRNNSSSPLTRLLVFGSLGFFTLVVAAVFSLAGAWPIAPFAGMECLGLFLAYWWLQRHDEDYELITIEGDNVVVEMQNGSKRERHQLSRFWAQVVIEETAGRSKRVFLRAHGRQIEFGRLLSDEARLSVAKRVRSKLTALV
jgi:uncharacterized membrane protein